MNPNPTSTKMTSKTIKTLSKKTVRGLVTVFVLLPVVGVLSLVTINVAYARVDAIYSVPTNDPGLIDASEFPTRSDQDQYGSPEASGTMRFSLPQELIGRDTDFELLRQTDGKWIGAGTDGSKVEGACATQGKKWFKCTVTFDGIIFDTIERETILAKQFGRGFEFDQRTKVARHFEGQPIGIIKVRIDRD